MIQRRLSDEDFGRVFNKTPGMIQKFQKRIMLFWGIGALLSVVCTGAVIYALIQGGLWLSRQ